MKNANDVLKDILKELAGIENVVAIGRTNDPAMEIRPGESDIDVFVYCDIIPSEGVRSKIYEHYVNAGLSECQINAISSGLWGIADKYILAGVETWIMYFSASETLDEVEEILAGHRLDKEGEFYPIGRLATLKNIHVCHDERGYLQSIKNRLKEYPKSLAKAMIAHHRSLLNDEEDFGSAVRRKDVFFYHAVIDDALNHFLQCLFALNNTFFPSRKRSESFLKRFESKPERCYERIVEILSLGTNPDTLNESYSAWVGLAEDLKKLMV
jgi:hypothetical protein